MKTKLIYWVSPFFSLMILASGFVQAQNFPSMPIKLIVPYAPGGGTDISARLIAKYVSASLGQPVIIENKPGAGTVLVNCCQFRSTTKESFSIVNHCSNIG